MSFAKTLSRDEMKNVMAGNGCCDGNIYCSYNGNQKECDQYNTLEDCTDWCSTAWGPYCGGCAQFPEEEN